MHYVNNTLYFCTLWIPLTRQKWYYLTYHFCIINLFLFFLVKCCLREMICLCQGTILAHWHQGSCLWTFFQVWCRRMNLVDMRISISQPKRVFFSEIAFVSTHVNLIFFDNTLYNKQQHLCICMQIESSD